MASLRNWVFTWNNPPDHYELPVHPKEKYVVFQIERVSTVHMQGYIELSGTCRLAGMKAWLPDAHFEPRKGSADQARAYCMKEESRIAGPWQRGERASKQGKRSDLDALKEAITAGASRRELLDDYSEVVAKYPRFVTEYTKLVREAAVEKLPTFVARFPWQAGVMEMIAEPPHDRQLLWVYDAVGNHGKTYLAKYLVQEHGAFYCNGGKSVDLTYAYSGEPIVIFDYVRDAKEFVGYGVIEQLKNGILMSTKYESGMKRFPVPHVIILANFRPADGKFSEDRLQIIELNSIGQVI